MFIKELQNDLETRLNHLLNIKRVFDNYTGNTDISIETCGNGELYFTATAHFSAQKKAPLGEKFFCHQLHFTPVPSSADRGDAHDDNFYYEFKTSFTNDAHNLNIRQLRLWQDVDYYYCAYIDEHNLNDSLFFILTKEQMINEVALCGSYTHGTIKANSVNQHCEYSITIPLKSKNSEKTKRWKELYLSNELKEKIFYGCR